MSVRRIYVEKKAPYAVEADHLWWELRHMLPAEGLTNVRVLQRYDVEGISTDLWERCKPIVFFEPQLDDHWEEMPSCTGEVLAVEYLPGQYDQRAASAEECIQLVGQCDRPRVRSARVYVLEGELSAAELQRIRRHLINPVDSRESSLEKRDTLEDEMPPVEMVQTLDGFIHLTREALGEFVRQYALAMDQDDLAFCQAYFREEQRDPTMTEIRMIDTYWSDHCRHTTFLTHLTQVDIQHQAVEAAFRRYLEARKAVYGERTERPITLMDMATIGGKYLKHQGRLPNLDESEEINACSIRIQVDVDGKEEPWLLMFKNETHNHPTEIEPFGGAATCIGGAIRDPLSGRTYVYQAMRVTGAGDPLVPVQDTIPGKLPQRKLVTTAAAGYSSYGNQIGLATGLVDEQYHPGYVAKRLEIGAVVGAAPAQNVRREVPAPGDQIVLLGGRTGRDGCGGATGSSKSHNQDSIHTCGAEVQKGNAPTERKLQRLFRNPEVTRLIKRCNDFGAGGVSVAIGELADGLLVDLDAVPRKYNGLDGTELAISESQERMAVVLAPEDVASFLRFAQAENLEATVVAQVTAEPRLRMIWQGVPIVDLARSFLNSNGAVKRAQATVQQDSITGVAFSGDSLSQRLMSMATHLNICSKQGLSERFDATIGAATVMMPYGGIRQRTPIQTMVAKLPLEHGETNTVSGMAYGFHPELMAQSPYQGAYLAVVESVAKLVAAGFDHRQAYLTLQEYFQRLGTAPDRWGQPVAALLGALAAQLDLGLAAIGGKDSMSGTYEGMDVPPTLCSFAVAPGKAQRMISPEFKGAGHEVRLVRCTAENPSAMQASWDGVTAAIGAGQILSAWAVGLGGVAEGLLKMGLGNHIGVCLAPEAEADLFDQAVGSLLIECGDDCPLGTLVGVTTDRWAWETTEGQIALQPVEDAYEGKMANLFPHEGRAGEKTETFLFSGQNAYFNTTVKGKPRALIPVFPGTNCEVDTLRALERVGGEGEIEVIRNLTTEDIADSIQRVAEEIRRSQMIILPGGFSGGDEPDGSAKFITAFFRNPDMRAAVVDLMDRRGGLMLGICNGFQALIKLGLVPFGRIVDTDEECPTLTFNEIGRHQSMLVRTRVSSTLSPWLSRMNVGDVHLVAISHGEGRFVGPEALVKEMAVRGQIATQYVDLQGSATMDQSFNPNGSYYAIEGITSPDGRILGKMGHTERSGPHLYKNVPGNTWQPLFEGAMDYFRRS